MNKNDLQFRVGELRPAVALVREFHYSHRSPSNIQFVGTFHQPCGQVVAAVFFSIPPTRWRERVFELSRLVRHEDHRPSLSQLISLAVRAIQRDRLIDLLVSYADAAAGHHGGIYQACSWHYTGQRSPSMDGLVINGQFVPGRSCNSTYGTRSPTKLRLLHPDWTIEPHYDIGKHLYWRSLSKTGLQKADRLKLRRLPYPKPDHEMKTP